MPSTLIIVIIYLAFISLGLPDSVLGVAWPTMRLTINAKLEAAGLIALLLTGCSATSSFMSVRLLRRFKTGPIIATSTFLTVIGILGYALAPSFFWVFLAAIPLGFGQGAIDSSLNHFVAKNFSSRHMNWLHACWGVGATLGPLIMTGMIATSGSWRNGYFIIAFIQTLLTLTLVMSSKLFKNTNHKEYIVHNELSTQLISGMRHVEPWIQIFMYAFYTACECAVGIWTASMLVESRNYSQAEAGFWVSLYFGAITVGRILTGIIADKFGNRFMVKWGLSLALVGAFLLFNQNFHYSALVGLLLLGLGFSPVYPCLMHETPRRFTHETAERVIAYQIGAASIGASVIPATIGLIASHSTLEILAPTIGGFILILGMMNWRLNKQPTISLQK